MEVTKTLYVSKRSEWRDWLKDHYENTGEIWLVNYLKKTGKPNVSYNDAVEEALCFGWIDSTVKKLDEDRSVQRYTPRKARSGYSQTNKERLKKLLRQGKLMPEVMAILDAIGLEDFEYPPDIMAALQENAQVWENFERYSGAYQRIRIAYIHNARGRPGEYEKRLAHLIKMTKRDKQFGHGIEDYY